MTIERLRDKTGNGIFADNMTYFCLLSYIYIFLTVTCFISLKLKLLENPNYSWKQRLWVLLKFHRKIRILQLWKCWDIKNSDASIKT